MNFFRSFLMVCVFGFAMESFAAEVVYIITLRPDADGEKVAKELTLKTAHIYRHALKGFAASLDDNQVKKLKKDKRVLAVEPNGRIELFEQSNSTGIIRMGVTNFPLARINGLDERIDVDVAVIDTGVQIDHPDLNVVQAVSVVEGRGPADWHGHGTHVAGIIGALSNDFGVVGVAPGARLWSVQIFDAEGFGSWDSFIAALDYVAANADAIEIVNASIGGSFGPYEAVRHAVSNVVNLGVVFVAAAGNTGTSIEGGDHRYGINPISGDCDDVLPGGLPEVMAVSAMDPIMDKRWPRSNYSRLSKEPRCVISLGLGIEVTAPGVDILSTSMESSYTNLSGTSMAAAHVSGLIALNIAANGRATNSEGVYRIRQSIVDGAQPQSEWENGNGIDVDGNPEPLAILSDRWLRPRLTGQFEPRGFGISFFGASNYTYRIQARDSLASSNQWNDLIITNGVGRAISVADGTWPGKSFYRLAREKAPSPPAAYVTNFNWFSSGKPWFSQTNVTHDSGEAFQSGATQFSEESVMETTLEGPGVLSFWWKVVSGSANDLLEFYVDGVLKSSMTGELSNRSLWMKRRVSISGGSHMLRWRYYEQGWGGFGSDAGWVDEIMFAVAPSPVFHVQPEQQFIMIGGTATFSATVVGIEPLTYQWELNDESLVDGNRISGSHSNILEIVNVKSGDAGNYQLVVSNSFGVATSAVANLTVQLP